jgi:hypothetical protein
MCVEVPMDYLVEAKKFIERAREAHCSEVIKTDLEMAEWFLAKAIEEREGTSRQEAQTSTSNEPTL